MAIGTAGFTAMLCVMTLEEAGIKPGSGAILVTGAAGGVGSVAVAVLSNLGYRCRPHGPGQRHPRVPAATGRNGSCGGTRLDEMPRPLENQRWIGAIDTVGGKVLTGCWPR